MTEEKYTLIKVRYRSTSHYTNTLLELKRKGFSYKNGGAGIENTRWVVFPLHIMIAGKESKIKKIIENNEGVRIA